MIITGVGMITGNWQNDLSSKEYLIHYKQMDSYGHPTSTKSVKRFNEEVNKERKDIVREKSKEDESKIKTN